MFSRQQRKANIHKHLNTRFIIDKTVSKELENDIKDFIVLFSTMSTAEITIYFEYATDKQINKRIAHFDKNDWEQIYISTYKNRSAKNTYTIIATGGLISCLNYLSKALANVLLNVKHNVINTKDDSYKEKLERLYVDATSIMLLYNTKKITVDNQYENYDQTLMQVSCGLTDEPLDRVMDNTEKYIAYLIGICKTTDDVILSSIDKKLLSKMEKQIRLFITSMTLETSIENSEINSYKITKDMLKHIWENGGMYTNTFDTSDIDIPDIFFGGDDI